jgi:methionyl-tRNA formyltransferase
MKDKKIVLLAGKGVSTNIVYQALQARFGVNMVIIEKGSSKKKLLKNRMKRLGLWKVFGQIIFQVLVVKILDHFSKKRKQEIIDQYQLNTSQIPGGKITLVESVNDFETIDLLKKINPDLVIVNGTRIISSKVLTEVNCQFINTHVGITPKYRGVHGGYWALYNQDQKNFGVTIHFVDSGVDTGKIIEQAKTAPAHNDNFSTYTLLQLAIGIPVLISGIESYFSDQIKTKFSDGESKLWFHPTVWQYTKARATRGIK